MKKKKLSQWFASWNGIQSWKETYYEVVVFISNVTRHIDDNNPNEECKIEELYQSEATKGMYQLADMWTEEFEKEYINTDWNEVDYWETIENWLNKKRYE